MQAAAVAMHIPHYMTALKKIMSVRVPSMAATVEEVLCSSRGNGTFTTLMAFAFGMVMLANGTQVTLLSYLVPCVATDWDLSSAQEGTLTASVFAGELVCGMVFGVISDAYGRRAGVQLSAGLVAVFGVLTAVAPSYWWLLACRALVGAGVGGGQVAFDLLGELIPKKEKTRILVDIQALWAVGSIVVGVVSWAVLSLGYSWRWIAFFTAIPASGAICCFMFIPESPRWLLARGREKAAKDVLRQIAKRNAVVLINLSIVPDEQPKFKEGGVLDLWRTAELRKRTIVSCIVWTSFGFLYYGVILLSAKLLGDDGTCSFEYSILFFASCSELMATAVTRMYFDKLDWTVTQTINFLVSGIMAMFMPLDRTLSWLLLTSFVARGTAYISSSMSWIITPELYPTEVRCTGHSISSCFAHIGAMGASYCVAYTESNQVIGYILLVVGVLGGFSAQVFPRNLGAVAKGRDRSMVDETESKPLL